MQRHPTSLVELHFEKALLGATALLALWTGWCHLIESPHTVRCAGRELTPRELNRVILSEAAELEASMRSCDVPRVDVPPYHEQLRELHAGGIFHGNTQSGGFLMTRLPRATTWGVPLEDPLSSCRPVHVATPRPPTRPTLLTGRALLAAKTAVAPGPDGLAAAATEVTWIRIAARCDLQQQRAALLAAGYPDYAAGVHLAGLDAQRQQLLPDGEFTPWQDVEQTDRPSVAPIPKPVFDDRSGRLLNCAVLSDAFVQIKQSQARLARPDLGPIIAGDIPPASLAEGEVDVDESAPDAAIAVWAYDHGVEPGKTYRYRLRVRLWNRFVGRTHAVLEPADAAQATIAGEWSRPSDPVTAAARSHVFLLGPGVGGSGANVEVWKWHLGRWLRKSFAVAVGDLVGEVRSVRTGDTDESGRPVREKIDFGSGYVVLDIRTETRPVRVSHATSGAFHWTEQPTLVLVCRDPAEGGVIERSQADDRNDPVRMQLRRASAMTAQAPGDPEPPPGPPPPPDRIPP